MRLRECAVVKEAMRVAAQEARARADPDGGAATCGPLPRKRGHRPSRLAGALSFAVNHF